MRSISALVRPCRAVSACQSETAYPPSMLIAERNGIRRVPCRSKRPSSITLLCPSLLALALARARRGRTTDPLWQMVILELKADRVACWIGFRRPIDHPQDKE